MSEDIFEAIESNFEQSLKIGLVVDEGADLPPEIIDRHKLTVVSFKMDWPDLENSAGENTFQKMRELERKNIKSFGKTSQPSPKDFISAFNFQLDQKGIEEVICITITSKHSGTYNSACQAKNFLDVNRQNKVFILDSLSGSCGQGLLVLKAIDLIKKREKGAEEILKELEDFRSQITLRGILKDPKWLEASGRISSTIAGWIRKIEKLGLRPLIGIKKGEIKAVGIKAGAKDIPIALFKEFEERTKKIRGQNKKIRVAITHGDNLEMAQKLKENIEENFKEVEIAYLSLVDNVLGVLLGPDALILSWVEG